MKESVLRAKINGIFGTGVFSKSGDSAGIVYDNNEITLQVFWEAEIELEFKHLKMLSDLCKTSDMTVQYTAQGEPYSAYTPGDPAEFKIVIKNVGIEIEDD